MIYKRLWALFCLLWVTACSLPDINTSKSFEAHEAGKIYKVLGTHTSVSDKAWVREFFSDIDVSAATAIKPYIRQKVDGEIARSFTGDIPALLRTEIIYTNYGNSNSKLLLGVHGSVRARLTLIDPYTGLTYKQVFASGLETSAATTLGRLTGRFGALAARVIQTSVQGKKTTEQRFENIANSFAAATIRNFNQPPEKPEDPSAE